MKHFLTLFIGVICCIKKETNNTNQGVTNSYIEKIGKEKKQGNSLLKTNIPEIGKKPPGEEQTNSAFNGEGNPGKTGKIEETNDYGSDDEGYTDDDDEDYIDNEDYIDDDDDDVEYIRDLNSKSRPDQARVTKIHIDLEIDFEKQVLSGFVILDVIKVMSDAKSIILDCENLAISLVTEASTKKSLTYRYRGHQLEIDLPKEISSQIKIMYSTPNKDNQRAVQWLQPEKTLGKRKPFMVSMCQTINCRTMLPCQDTPSVKMPYTANITSPPGVTVLMSAIRDKQSPIKLPNGMHLFSFNQKNPVTSYNIGIAAGHLESRRLGPRSHVWAEKEIIDDAVKTLSDTDKMLTMAEKILGPYQWEIYDILVSPNLPVNGLEHPTITFVTSRILNRKEKSLPTTIIHELIHSWSGNLVTCINFEHWWLNEGITRFLELKFVEKLYNQDVRQTRGLKAQNVVDSISIIAKRSAKKGKKLLKYLKLVTNLKSVAPHEVPRGWFNTVAYNKGCLFMWYLEFVVGPERMDQFLRSYFAKYKFKSISSDEFKNYFIEMNKNGGVRLINWDSWLNNPGQQPFRFEFDKSLIKKTLKVAENMVTGDMEDGSEFDELDFSEKLEVLLAIRRIINRKGNKVLTQERMDKFEDLFKFTEPDNNLDYQSYWAIIGLKIKWKKAIAFTMELLDKTADRGLLKVLYNGLSKWKPKTAKKNFEKNKDSMMPVTQNIIKKYLNWK